jgi:hypothetical protein
MPDWNDVASRMEAEDERLVTLSDAFHVRTQRCLGGDHSECALIEQAHLEGEHAHCLPVEDDESHDQWRNRHAACHEGVCRFAEAGCPNRIPVAVAAGPSEWEDELAHHEAEARRLRDLLKMPEPTYSMGPGGGKWSDGWGEPRAIDEACRGCTINGQPHRPDCRAQAYLREPSAVEVGGVRMEYDTPSSDLAEAIRFHAVMGLISATARTPMTQAEMRDAVLTAYEYAGGVP